MTKLESNRLIEDDYVYINEVKNVFPNDKVFNEFMEEVDCAIKDHVLPLRNAKGSSGSYVVRNVLKKNIGVFKPKDEEPYGLLNPKWTKWMHKWCCPWCFGRSCLVPNQGYLSEAGASLVDEKLGLGIVPKTRVVRLASETFNYSPVDRAKSRTKISMIKRYPSLAKHFHRLGLPPKVGSFQIFVEGFNDADFFLRQIESEPLPDQLNDDFLFQFEKLVCLDYIIRNTDRGNDNWLVKYTLPEKQVENKEENTDARSQGSQPALPMIKIAAIDNGLAFPYKHPDEWRTYPFHWAWLPFAKLPFSQKIKDVIIPKLDDPVFQQSLFDDLHRLFQTDKGFDKSTFNRQKSVLRGQILNLTTAMKTGKSPLELVQMPVLTIEKRPCGKVEKDVDSEDLTDSYDFTKYYKRPFFSWC